MLQRCDAPCLFDAPIPHNDNIVGETRGLSQVVGDQQCCKAELTADPLKGFVRFAARNGVERPERLVEQDDLLSRRECSGESDPLALATRQLVRQSVGEGRRVESDAL